MRRLLGKCTKFSLQIRNEKCKEIEKNGKESGKLRSIQVDL